MTESKSPKIAFCVHAFKDVDFKVYFNHLYCMSHWTQKNPNLVYCGKKGLDAATARNQLVERAEENKCTHMLFVDADHLMPVEAIDCFMETVGGTSLESDEAIVSGLVVKRGEEFQQVGFLKEGAAFKPVNLPLDGNVYQVSICAFGCTMINMKKLAKLKKPYFRDECRTLPNGDKYNFRSDIILCENFAEVGEKCFIDTRVLVGHHGIDREVFPQNAGRMAKLLQMERECSKLNADQKGFYYEC